MTKLIQCKCGKTINQVDKKCDSCKSIESKKKLLKRVSETAESSMEKIAAQYEWL